MSFQILILSVFAGKTIMYVLLYNPYMRDDVYQDILVKILRRKRCNRDRKTLRTI